jgi:hypothetical protein
MKEDIFPGEGACRECWGDFSPHLHQGLIRELIEASWPVGQKILRGLKEEFPQYFPMPQEAVENLIVVICEICVYLTMVFGKISPEEYEAHHGATV